MERGRYLQNEDGLRVAYVETEVGNCEGSIIGWMYEHGDE